MKTPHGQIPSLLSLFCCHQKTGSSRWRTFFVNIHHSSSVLNSAMEGEAVSPPPLRVTKILTVDPSSIANKDVSFPTPSTIADWTIKLQPDSSGVENLRRAAKELRETDVPVAFPTETVYGLGADVTRSSAVLGIFKAKQRPSDNPLIVHVSSLRQLRDLLQPATNRHQPSHHTYHATNGELAGARVFSTAAPAREAADPIPEIYQPLIKRFWPGPLTLIMPNPATSALAPEVTAGLSTFGVRMPRSMVALALISLADVPLAAPSANASTKPSPTTAAHVKHDLDGRISTIIDGGPCDVGVESTVVDGLSSPPVILRPGGIGIDQLRACPGWEDVTIGYEDAAQTGSKPKAPGMKYKHYSPKARVILYEPTQPQPTLHDIGILGNSVGLIRTANWVSATRLSKSKTSNGLPSSSSPKLAQEKQINLEDQSLDPETNGTDVTNSALLTSVARKFEVNLEGREKPLEVWDIELGDSSARIARGLFSALRQMDSERVDVILVEGIDDARGGVAAAVMNRLRKAAETTVGL